MYWSFTHCAFIMDFTTNSYFILQIHKAKSFKMRHNTYITLVHHQDIPKNKYKSLSIKSGTYVISHTLSTDKTIIMHVKFLSNPSYENKKKSRLFLSLPAKSWSIANFHKHSLILSKYLKIWFLKSKSFWKLLNHANLTLVYK